MELKRLRSSGSHTQGVSMARQGRTGPAFLGLSYNLNHMFIEVMLLPSELMLKRKYVGNSLVSRGETTEIYL